MRKIDVDEQLPVLLNYLFEDVQPNNPIGVMRLREGKVVSASMQIMHGFTCVLYNFANAGTDAKKVAQIMHTMCDFRGFKHGEVHINDAFVPSVLEHNKVMRKIVLTFGQTDLLMHWDFVLTEDGEKEMPKEFLNFNVKSLVDAIRQG
jgi:hypothetical protein